MDFKHEKNRIYAEDEDGRVIAEVTFPETREGVVDINRTFVDDSLRGQGVAGQLVAAVCSDLAADGRKAVPTCSYAVKWFSGHPEREDILSK